MRPSRLDDPNPPTPPPGLPAHFRARRRRRRLAAAATAAAVAVVALAIFTTFEPDDDADFAVTTVAPSTSDTSTATSTTVLTRDLALNVAYVPDGYAPAEEDRISANTIDLVGWLSPSRGGLAVQLITLGTQDILHDVNSVDGGSGRTYKIGINADGRRQAQWNATTDTVVVLTAPDLTDDELTEVLDATTVTPA